MVVCFVPGGIPVFHVRYLALALEIASQHRTPHSIGLGDSHSYHTEIKLK